MRLQSFLEQFDQFVEAPEAVAKMRELVLGFAFTGRLTNKIPKSDGVPDGWENRTIGSIASSMTPGFACSKSHQVKGGHVHLRTHNVSTLGTFNFDLLVRIDPQMVDPQKATISRGDILFNNTNSQELVGKTCLVDRDYEYGFSNHITRIRLKPSVDSSFVVFYLTWLRNNGHFARLCTRWINQAAINTNTLKDQMIPLAPLGEQEQIVAKINELMSLCDRLETQQKERLTRCVELTRAAIARFDEAPTPANLNFLVHPSYSVTSADLRKTILNLAVKGKLVPQDPRDETAAASFSRLGLEGDTGSLNEIAQRDEQLPESWSVVRFEDVAIVTGGVTLGRKLADRKTVTLPYLRVANVKRGEIDVDVIKEVTIAEDEIERYALRKNDLLMTEGGDWDKVGRAAIWGGEISPCLHQNHIFRARMRSAEIKPFWFERYFNSPQGRSYFESASKQTTNLASINMRQVRGCLVPFPPLAEQNRILARVDLLMKSVDQLEQQIVVSEAMARELLNAVIHELMHPTADIIEFSRSEADSASQRAAIGCYAIEHLARNPSFGRTMLMKACYLAETHLGLPLGWQPMRQAAGPWDPWVQDFESLGTRSNWFAVNEKTLNNGHIKIEYSLKKALKTKAGEAVTVLGDQKTEFDRLLDLFSDKNTEEAEIITTLFAAWNDFLIDGKTPSDDEIIHEVRENWHHSKERFTPALLGRWLDWMRNRDLIPKGRGPRTRRQLTLGLEPIAIANRSR